jgi:aryl-alcohol dehydrogenase-like predicted oxidoreductase
MAQVALAWVLQQAAVTAVIAGARRPEQIRQNAQAIELELGPTIVDELAAATEELKQKLGPNPDMWDSESRIR